MPAALVIISILIFGANSTIVRNLKLGKKLYGGFGFVLLLAVGLGLWSYYFLSLVSEKSHLQTASLDLDMMAGELSSAKSKFLLYAISDKELGKQLLGEAKTLLTEYVSDIKKFQQFDLEVKELGAIKELESLVSQYKATFEVLAINVHKVEEEQAELGQFGNKLLEQVEELQREHKKILAGVEAASNLDRDNLALQRELVENLAQLEVLTLQLGSNRVGFMLDKGIKRIPVSENYLGQLFGRIEMAGQLMKQQTVDSKKNEANLKNLAGLETKFERYQEELGAMMANTLKVDGEAVELSSLLQGVESIAAALSHRFKLEAENAKSEANKILMVLTILTVIFGLVVAAVITRALRTTDPPRSCFRSIGCRR